jgi:hypothetical protein
MLRREDLRGRHHGRLMSRLDRDEARMDRNERLPRADVPLQEQVHRLGAPHRAVDVVHRAELGVGRLEGKVRAERAGEPAVGIVGDPPAIPREPVLAEPDPELEREELVELQPLPCRGELVVVGREMDPPKRGVPGRQGLGGDHPLGHRVGLG